MEVVVHFPILLNVLGHVAGITSFSAFLVLLFRGSRAAIANGWSAADVAAAAALAACWNLGALIVLLAEPGSRFQGVVAALSFAVLSLLPCTLLHLALRGEFRWLCRTGYTVGCAASLMHISNAVWVARDPAEAGIATIKYGFSALAVIAAVLLARGDFGRRLAGMRTLAAMALFLLAASLLGLMDALGLLQPEAGTAVSLAAFLVVASVIMVAYPPVLAWLGGRVQNALFRREDVRAAASRIRTLGETGEPGFLERASEQIARFVSANRWELLEPGAARDVARVEIAPAPCLDALTGSGRGWAAAAVPLPDGTGTARVLLLGERQGAQRFLGGDIADLERLSAEVGRRIERMRRDEQDNLLRDAEMATLRAQINPHFLFNALNALNGIIPTAAMDARKTLLNLADIFRYSLDSKRQFVSLREEMRIVEAYLQIERLRLGNRLTTRIDLDDRVRSMKIPALSIQPLVENAVKHGVSSKPHGGEVRVMAHQVAGALDIEVSDDGEGFDPPPQSTRGHGLRSVERRLQLCYGGAVEFRIDTDRTGSRVGFRVRLDALENQFAGRAAPLVEEAARDRSRAEGSRRLGSAR